MVPNAIKNLVSDLYHHNDLKELDRAELYLSEFFCLKCLQQEDDTIILEILSLEELAGVERDDISELKKSILTKYSKHYLPLGVRVVIFNILSPTASSDVLEIANDILLKDLNNLSLNDLHKILSGLEICLGLKTTEKDEASVIESMRLISGLEVKIDRLKELIVNVKGVNEVNSLDSTNSK